VNSSESGASVSEPSGCSLELPTFQLSSGISMFLLSARWTRSARALLEAMACGRATVATAVGGVPEILEGPHGICGRAGPPQQPDLLAGALTELCACADLRRRLGAMARARVVQSFSSTREWTEYLNMYVRGSPLSCARKTQVPRRSVAARHGIVVSSSVRVPRPVPGSEANSGVFQHQPGGITMSVRSLVSYRLTLPNVQWRGIIRIIQGDK